MMQILIWNMFLAFEKNVFIFPCLFVVKNNLFNIFVAMFVLLDSGIRKTLLPVAGVNRHFFNVDPV